MGLHRPDTFLRDLHFTWRLALRQPWTMAAAVASIAIGVGANVAVTSVVHTVLLNPLGIKNAGRLIAATVHVQKLQMTGAEASGPDFRDLQSATDLFSAVAATEPRAWTLAGDQPVRLPGVAVTSDFFKVFGVQPILGTLKSTNENQIVLSDAVWKEHFGRSPAALGRKLLLDGQPYEVIGVAPPDFHFPAQAQAWLPRVLHEEYSTRGVNMTLSLYARLNKDVSLKQAQQRVKMLDHNGYGMDVEPLAWRVAGDLRPPLLFLWVAALVLFMASCANVAGLWMARAGSRRKEIAIRIAIGAGKRQILRQLMTESFLLALLGGLSGFALAVFLLAALKRQPLPFQNLLTLAKLDAPLLLYGLALAAASSLLFGLAPAFELLREQHVQGLARAGRKWFQNAYIIGQVAAAMLLLVVMGLLLKSLQAVEWMQPGFDAAHVTTALLTKPTGSLDIFYSRLLSKLRASPGVQSAALAYPIPFAPFDGPTLMFDIQSRHRQPGDPEWQGKGYQVSPDYFEALRIPLLRGRQLQASDTAGTPRVCVIDETLANRFFRREEPIGQHITMHGDCRVVVVVASVRDETVEHDSKPAIYYALAQIPYFPEVGMVLRSSVPAARLIRSAVSATNPQVAVFDIKTIEERMDQSQTTRSVTAFLVTGFAAISILLAALGVHGVVSQVVTERTTEIGIRMALGARSADIFQRYAGQGLALSLAGIAIGLAAAWACAGFLHSLLFRVEAMDPSAIGTAALGVLLVSIAAVLAPAWRASHVDPQTALRRE